MDAAQGIAQELQSVQLGDKRRNERARKVLEDLFANPQASINAACNGWGDTMAAYRLFKNPQVDAHQILQSHAQESRKRFEPHPCILLVQDTTELDFSDHPSSDSGVLNTPTRFGLYDHTHAAFTPEGLCLGVLAVEFYSRHAETLGQSQQKKKQPQQERESYRWVRGYQLACELAGQFPEKQIISVADCESDLYEIFLEHARCEHPADFVIRAKQPRRTPQLDPEGGPKVYLKVRQALEQSEVVAERLLDLPHTPQRTARTARLQIRAKAVTVKPPYNAKSSTAQVHYNAILVQELGGPGDGSDVCWELITTLPIDSLEQILLVIDTYVGRWPIEVYFRTFKSGCRVEQIQLESQERRIRAMMFYKIIAWRVMYLTSLGRECPQLSCETLFERAEWKPVWRIVRKKPLPAKPPSLSEFLLMLGQLGGHNNRASDRPPGPQAIWTGVRRMSDFAIAWQAFGPDG